MPERGQSRVINGTHYITRHLEATKKFPGVDIDAVHYGREKKLNRIVRSIQRLGRK